MDSGFDGDRGFHTGPRGASDKEYRAGTFRLHMCHPIGVPRDLGLTCPGTACQSLKESTGSLTEPRERNLGGHGFVIPIGDHALAPTDEAYTTVL